MCGTRLFPRLALGLLLPFAAACSGDADGAGGMSEGAGGAGGLPPTAEVTSGFVAASFGFFYPESIDSPFVGFDLDERVSSAESAGDGECPHDDFVGPNGQEGIDYNFLRIIFDDRIKENGEFFFGGFREGEIVDGVINGAVKNGSMTVLLDVQGIDDPQNDDDVTVQVFGSEDSPMKGTDDEVLAFATLSVHPDPAYHTERLPGRIVDGVLTAGPFDLVFPINVQIVSDEFVIREAWLQVELGDDTFQGFISGLWDVNNIRDIIGKPTTDNGNAANFTIEEFEEAMLTHADAAYDSGSGVCTAFTTMFRFGGVQAFIARAGGSDPGVGGEGGSMGPMSTPTDQCLGPEDQAALDSVGGAGAIGVFAAECPASSCGTELTDVLTSGGSDTARVNLGDCIAQCISDGSGLSRACTDCYGSIAACSTSFCLQPCAADPGSAECAQCAIDNCPNLDDCTGL
ncbi:MAG: hypothetical protein AAF500_05090 [Myxococcota bacterium]